jgi:hypothetical protein
MEFRGKGTPELNRLSPRSLMVQGGNPSRDWACLPFWTTSDYIKIASVTGDFA